MDYLQERIAHDVANDPGFAEVWAPCALMIKLVDERIRLGLTQAEMASRMGVTQAAVARMENNPPGVSFARILAYTHALGADLAVIPSAAAPKTTVRRPRSSRTSKGLNAGQAPTLA
ncbi:MAG: helix-turn-helix domain-containing protein [Fimbriimonas sp.]